MEKKLTTDVRTQNNFNGVDTKSTFTTVDKFLGYRSREDKTMLPGGYMIYPSQNVLIDITGRLKNRPGYTLYGASDMTITPIYAYHDWEEHKNGLINLRAYSGNLQFDYNGTWVTIKDSLGLNHIRFTNYWNNGEVENVLLFVDGSSNVYEWNGATTTVLSITANTITKSGTTTWAEDGFYVTGNKKIMIRGVEYTYTGGESTTTLTGVTPDPTAQSINTPIVGDLVFQSVITTANSSMTALPVTFINDFISVLGNQVYYGSLASNNIYVSKQNNYKDCSFTAPVRVVGEGALITLRSLCSGFVVQEDTMYIAGGKSQWYTVKKTLSSDNSKEVFDIIPLKTSAKQGPLSQEGINHDRDSVVFLSNETRLVTLGRTLNIFGTPMMTDYSYPIAKDFDMFDFTDASVKFWKSKLYIAIPRESKWYIFNQTDPNNMFWEAPQTGAFSGFMIDNNGDLYAHGYSTPETYKLFNGGSDNSHHILSRAKFAYISYGNRGLSDYFSQYWMEGYISPNTKLKTIYNLDLDGCSSQVSGILSGDNSKVVCLIKDRASLGKVSLGKNPLGSQVLTTNPDDVPPYFNAVMVTPKNDFWKFSAEFESYGVDFNWQLISFGPLVTATMFGNNSISIPLA